MVKAAILGASGYGGGELLRWLTVHPQAEVAIATSATYAGKPVSASFPGMAKRLDLAFAPSATTEELATCDVVFSARDNGVAMKAARELVEAGCRIIDLSADFRFRDTTLYNQWYPGPHASPDLAAQAVYGMPELHKEAIRSAAIVGNPGCYTTASILALAPLVKEGAIDPATIIVDAKSGVSGAGRSKFAQDYHYPEANESVTAYKVAGTHRHTPEIEQELGALAGAPVAISFTPHLVPMTRGILATSYATLTCTRSAADLREAFRAFYADAPFVYITDGLPSTKHTLGSNMLHIGLQVDARLNRITVVSCLDNLGKGMAGQAIQNMNLMFGLDETAGLGTPGLWP